MRLGAAARRIYGIRRVAHATRGQIASRRTGAPMRSGSHGGEGHFGANRGAGRAHLGVDIDAASGTTVKAPVSGVVEGNAFDPYGPGSRHHGNYQAVRIRTDDGHLVDVLYIAPDAKIGRDTVVVAGETVLGTAADLSKTYGNSVPNHIHLQTQKGGRFRDPTPYIKD